MSDEQPKKVQSVPPPATDEIDQEWGGTPPPPGVGSVNKRGDAPPAPAASAPHTPEAPLSASAREEDEEDEDEEDEEDEESAEGRQDDEDDEEEDDEDEHASSARPVARTASHRPASNSDWLPDWAPWAVLAALVVVGIVGGLGGLAKPSAERVAQAQAEAQEAHAAAPQPAAAEVAAVPETIEASHLLVAYQGAMRASPTIKRTKEEAKQRAQEALAKAKKGVPFEKLVSEYSDEPGAGARGGKLGSFSRQQMVKPFADAAFALKPGAISSVVETQFGFHVIQRTK